MLRCVVLGRLPSRFSLPRYRPMLWPCDCLSVYPSVRLSQVGVLSNRLNIESQKQRRTIAQTSSFLSFLMLQILMKFSWGHPCNDVTKYRWGNFKSAIFDQYRDICVRKGAKRGHSYYRRLKGTRCNLSKGAICSDLE